MTVECNPDTVTLDLLREYRRGGVTRLSFGVQSMVPHVLASLGRTHDSANVVTSVRAARDAGFDAFNLDLIYGAAGESITDWSVTLEQALSLDPPHLSAYGLTIEAGTPLADMPERHPDDDDQADKYLVADRALAGAGLHSYEISNWARPGFECRHNLLYWSQGEYLGVGCAAHSHRGARAGGTSARRTATSTRSGTGKRRSPRPSISPTPSAASRRCSSRSARATVCPRRRCPMVSRTWSNAVGIESC